MRFSLKTLIALVTLASIGVSGFQQISKISQLHHRTNDTQAQLRSIRNSDQRKQRNQEILEPRLRSLQAECNRSQAVREQIEHLLESLVPEFSKIVPAADQISVRKIPTLKMETGLKKQFVVYVPANRCCLLKIKTTSSQKKSKPIGADYLMPETDSLPLAVGFNRVRFSFCRVEQIYKIQVSVNDAQPIEIELVQPRSSGFSWSIYDFENQKDYDLDDKLPKLVRFKPSSCDNNIELILLERPSVGSGELP